MRKWQKILQIQKLAVIHICDEKTQTHYLNREWILCQNLFFKIFSKHFVGLQFTLEITIIRVSSYQSNNMLHMYLS